MAWLIDAPVIVATMVALAAATLGAGQWWPAVLGGYTLATIAATLLPLHPGNPGPAARLRIWIVAPWDLLWSTLLRYSLPRTKGRFALIVGAGCLTASSINTIHLMGLAGAIVSAWFTYVVAIRPLLWPGYATPLHLTPRSEQSGRRQVGG